MLKRHTIARYGTRVVPAGSPVPRPLLLAFVVSAVLVSLVIARPAKAATFTYNDPQCASVTATDQGGGTLIVGCSSVDCTIVPATLTPTAQTNVTLSASCSPPTSDMIYVWTKLNVGNPSCPAAPSPGPRTTISAPNAVALGCSYRLTASSAAYGVATRTTVINWSP